MTVHKWRPVTLRDGSIACGDCYGRKNTMEHIRATISDEFLDAVEDECGMGAGAWDMIDPKDIIAAVVAVSSRFI